MNRSHRRRRSTSLGLLAGVALLGVACSENSDPGLTEPSVDPVPAVDGMTYLSESITGRDLVPRTRLRLSFDSGSLGADAGCNQMGGRYDIDGGALVVDAMSMTEMFCGEPAGLMEQEQWFAEFLGSGPSFVTEGDRLTLSTAGVTVVFLDREVADPDRPLEGTTWDVTAAVDGDAVSSVPPGGSVIFVEGTVEVDTTCNTGRGSYELSSDGQTITVGPIALTRMGCVDEESQLLEQAMIATLDGPLAVAIEAANLSLMGKDVGLQFAARE